MLPGVYSVIVPLPSVVVVVVVVSETCAHANGAAMARAILINVFFIYFSLSITRRVNTSANELFPVTEAPPAVVAAVIGRGARFGCKSANSSPIDTTNAAANASLLPVFQRAPRVHPVSLRALLERHKPG